MHDIFCLIVDINFIFSFLFNPKLYMQTVLITIDKQLIESRSKTFCPKNELMIRDNAEDIPITRIVGLTTFKKYSFIDILIYLFRTSKTAIMYIHLTKILITKTEIGEAPILDIRMRLEMTLKTHHYLSTYSISIFQ